MLPCIHYGLYLKNPPSLSPNRLMHFLPSSFSSLPSPLIPAAMSSGSALSHLINRNLCYNDLSMSLWLDAYAMSAGDSVALVALILRHSSHIAGCCLRVQHPIGQPKAGTLLAGHAGQTSVEAPALLCAVFPFPLIICCLFCQDDLSELLILMQVIYVIK